MPRYFFHVLNNRAIIDSEGTELRNLDEARKMAVRTAGQIIISEGTEFWENGQWRMSVVDESGLICFTLDFAADTHGK